MRSDTLWARAREVEALFRPRLEALAAAHPQVGEVRGRGAMLAVELVTPGTTDPDPALTAAVSAACHQQGLVTLTAGTFGNVLRFLPPLVISDDDLRRGLEIVGSALLLPQ